MKIIFVPRTEHDVAEHKDNKIPDLSRLPTLWGNGYQLWTMDRVGKFDLANGDQLYVMPGHGMPGSGVVFWGTEDNSLTAEVVAQRTAARFPDCTGVSIKVYSCHSSEGGHDSFAARFARAFRPVGGTYEVTILGYRGAITPRPMELTEANVSMSKAIDFYKKKDAYKKTIPDDYTGPKESVAKGEKHRWSKINTAMFQSRAKEARDEVARLKADKGIVV